MSENRDQELGSQALAGALQSSFRLLQVAMLAMVVYIVFTGVYIVKPEEQAIVLRLGKVVGTKADRIRKPGLHFGFPYPLDEVRRVPVGKILTVSSTTHWYQLSDAEKQALANKEPLPPPPTLRPLVDGYVITGDTNILHCQMQLQYKVIDPVRYALAFAETDGERAVESLLRDALDNATLKIAAGYPADKVHRTAVDAFREEVQDLVAQLVAQYQLGCSVERVEYREDTEPPRQVAAAFNAVAEAEQGANRLIKEAEAYQTRVVGEAEEQAATIVGEAQADADRTLQRARADANAFQKLVSQYRDNPAVIRKKLWLDTLQRVLSNVDEKLISHGRGELRLNLSRDPRVVQELNRKAAQAGQEPSTEESAAGQAPAAESHDDHAH